MSLFDVMNGVEATVLVGAVGAHIVWIGWITNKISKHMDNGKVEGSYPHSACHTQLDSLTEFRSVQKKVLNTLGVISRNTVRLGQGLNCEKDLEPPPEL